MTRDNVVRREEFLKAHPGWQLYHVASERRWRAVRESTGTVLHNHDLGMALDAVEMLLEGEARAARPQPQDQRAR
jgi:hypothetical protein